jgi:hypothetical protein
MMVCGKKGSTPAKRLGPGKTRKPNIKKGKWTLAEDDAIRAGGTLEETFVRFKSVSDRQQRTQHMKTSILSRARELNVTVIDDRKARPPRIEWTKVDDDAILEGGTQKEIQNRVLRLGTTVGKNTQLKRSIEQRKALLERMQETE